MRRWQLASVVMAALAPGLASAQASDSWSRPAAAASAAPYASGPMRSRGEDHSVFKFKDGRSTPAAPATNQAVQASGKAGVLGSSFASPQADGRPAVNCAATPMDPACR